MLAGYGFPEPVGAQPAALLSVALTNSAVAVRWHREMV